MSLSIHLSSARTLLCSAASLLLLVGPARAQIPREVLDTHLLDHGFLPDPVYVVDGWAADRGRVLNGDERRILLGVGRGMANAGDGPEADLVVREGQDRQALRNPTGALTPIGRATWDVYDGLADSIQSLGLDPEWDYDQILAGDLARRLGERDVPRDTYGPRRTSGNRAGLPRYPTEAIVGGVEDQVSEVLIENLGDLSVYVDPERIEEGADPGALDWYCSHLRRAQRNAAWLEDYSDRRLEGRRPWEEDPRVRETLENIERVAPLLEGGEEAPARPVEASVPPEGLPMGDGFGGAE